MQAQVKKQREVFFEIELYMHEGKFLLRKNLRKETRKCSANALFSICIRRSCPMALITGVARDHWARPPTCKHTQTKVTLTFANREQTALAACWLILAGAAETGAAMGHHCFDPIKLQPREGCIEVGRHGHGSCGNADQPCST